MMAAQHQTPSCFYSQDEQKLEFGLEDSLEIESMLYLNLFLAFALSISFLGSPTTRFSSFILL